MLNSFQRFATLIGMTVLQSIVSSLYLLSEDIYPVLFDKNLDSRLVFIIPSSEKIVCMKYCL